MCEDLLGRCEHTVIPRVWTSSLVLIGDFLGEDIHVYWYTKAKSA